MNCKPGDLAVIVRDSRWSGWIVEVVCAIPKGEDFVAPDGTKFFSYFSDWLVKASRPFGRLPCHATCYAAVPDSSLRPIRDPGDDATDETLLWLPLPSKQKETA